MTTQTPKMTDSQIKLIKEKVLWRKKIKELEEREDEIEGKESELNDRETELDERELELDERESKIPPTKQELDLKKMEIDCDERQWNRHYDTMPDIEYFVTNIKSPNQKITYNLRSGFDKIYMYLNGPREIHNIKFTYEFETTRVEYYHISDNLIAVRNPFEMTEGTCTVIVQILDYVGEYSLITSKSPRVKIDLSSLERGRKQVLSLNQHEWNNNYSFGSLLPNSTKYIKLYFKVDDIMSKGFQLKVFQTGSFYNNLCVYLGCLFHCPCLGLEEWLRKPFFIQEISGGQRFEISNYNGAEYLQSIVLYQDPEWKNKSVITEKHRVKVMYNEIYLKNDKIDHYRLN